jgi:hypothetical protein
MDNNIHAPTLDLIDRYKTDPKGQELGFIYCLKFTDVETEETFWKVGVTSKTVEERFYAIRNLFEIETIKMRELPNLECAILEKQIHQEHAHLKHRPARHFSGYTECFSEYIEIEVDMKDINDVFEDDAEIVEVELDDVSSETELKSDTKSDISGDYNFVREKLIKSIVRGSELIDESVKAVKTDPGAPIIKATSEAVKCLTEASKSLIDLHEKIRAIEKEAPTATQDGEGTVNAKVVLKSTLSDLIRSIDEADKAQEG